jgi:hypothetical protein
MNQTPNTIQISLPRGEPHAIRIAEISTRIRTPAADGTPHRKGGTGEEGERPRLPLSANSPVPDFRSPNRPEGLASQQMADPPESFYFSRPWPGLDRLGGLQAIAGLFIGLIALFSSYDHITLAGRSLPLPQQWGIPCIAASVALVLVDAQLATRARDRAAHEADRAADEADRDRNCAAEVRERQGESLERLNQAAVLSARVQLDPSPTNRARLRAFLALTSGEIPPDAGKDGP